MRSARVLAVDLGASRVACAVLRRASGSVLAIEQVAIERLEIGESAENDWQERTARALRAATARLRFRGPIRLALPAHLALTKSVRTPSIERSRRSRVVAFEARQGIPYPLDQVWWDHVVLPEGAGRDLDLVLLAAKRDAVAAVCASALATGGWLERATPVALALRDALRFSDADLVRPTLLVDVGARSTVLLACLGEQVWIRAIALGGHGVTRTLAEALDRSWPDAEAFKLRAATGESAVDVGAAEREAFDRAADQFGGRLQLEIARSLAGLREHSPGGEPARILLSGGATRLPTLTGLLRSKFGVEVERFDPLRRVICRSEAGGARAHGDGLAGVVGLVAADMLARPMAAGNLLPPTLQRAARRRRRRPAVAAAAALFIVALMAPTWYFDRIAEDARAKAAAEEARLVSLRAIAQRNAANLARLDEARRELAQLSQAAEAKSYWVRFLADLQERIFAVDDVWIEQLVVTRPDGAIGEGHGASVTLRFSLVGQLALADGPALQGSEAGYARVQRLLAHLAESPFIAAIDRERFDTQPARRLQFACVVAVNPPAGLTER